MRTFLPAESRKVKARHQSGKYDEPEKTGSTAEIESKKIQNFYLSSILMGKGSIDSIKKRSRLLHHDLNAPWII